MRNQSNGITDSEKNEIKKALLGFVKRVSQGGFQMHAEEVSTLPRIVEMLLNWEKEKD